MRWTSARASWTGACAGDPRVKTMEGTNIMSVGRADLDPLPARAVADLSFRSLQGAARHILDLTTEGWGIFLVKPQFELRRPLPGFRGVVRSAGRGARNRRRSGSAACRGGRGARRRRCLHPSRGGRETAEFLFLLRLVPGMKRGKGARPTASLRFRDSAPIVPSMRIWTLLTDGNSVAAYTTWRSCASMRLQALRVEAKALVEVHDGGVTLDRHVAHARFRGNHGDEPEVQLLRGGPFQQSLKGVPQGGIAGRDRSDHAFQLDLSRLIDRGEVQPCLSHRRSFRLRRCASSPRDSSCGGRSACGAGTVGLLFGRWSASERGVTVTFGCSRAGAGAAAGFRLSCVKAAFSGSRAATPTATATAARQSQNRNPSPRCREGLDRVREPFFVAISTIQ